MTRAALALAFAALPIWAEEADLTSAGTRDLKLAVGKRNRTFRLHVPRSREPDEALPLVVVLHGLLMTGPRMEEITGFSALAEERAFAVAYPNGLGSRWRHTPSEQDSVDDVAFIRELIDRLVAAGTADARRVYVCGFSNGAFFANRLACELPDRIAAIGLVAGTIQVGDSKTMAPPRPIPVVSFHGTEDRIVPWDGQGPLALGFLSAEGLCAWWAKMNGCAEEPEKKTLRDREDDGTSVERRIWKAAKGGAEVRLYRIEGGGHTWPGGKPWMEALLGRTSADVSATRRMWDFFCRHAAPERK